MELGLSLGDSSRPVGFMEKPPEASNRLELGFNSSFINGPITTQQRDKHKDQVQEETSKQKHSHPTSEEDHEATNEYLKNNAVLQLDLLPHTPVVAHTRTNPCHLPLENGGSCSRGLEEAEEKAALSSSPNSAASSFQMYKSGDQRASDNEDDNTRKKLRLSKEQSAFLEQSFKHHNTLNPKQKLALAKQLHLRPRQVEVWFQNRRARTKLKQTEVDCEYLRRCCETLTEDNRRLHKELQELRALKTSNSFYTQLPATTLTMCPSCERVATNNSTSTSSANTINEPTSKVIGFYPQHLDLN